VVGMPGWKFVDWTALDSRRNDGVVQGWYLEALEYAAKLATLAGDKQSRADYLRRAKKLRRTLAQAYWSQTRRAFLKYRPGNPERPANAPADLIGQHENFLFYLLDVGTAAQRKQALEAIAGATGLFLPDLGAIQNPTLMETRGNFASERTILIGSPFWSFYALLALMKSGKAAEALDYIRIGWGTMLENGATTCWEVWGRHMIVGSLCHGWSAAPAMILPAYVLGVRPLTPGFRLFEVRPRPGDLAWAEGTVPTPHGEIRVSWKRRAKGYACSVTVPEGTKARFVGDHLSRRRTIVLKPGRHEI
jgi:alpha-L-rhamnosidase